MSHFISSKPFIIGNDRLRDPQIQSYHAIKNFYQDTTINNREALVVLPTGCGKTGVMAIAPYGISKKKVLIITPQTVVRNTVVKELNPFNPLNFYLVTEIFKNRGELPAIIEYEKSLSDDVLSMSDIVILNVHKLQERLDSSLLKRVNKDFFDFIIIDEAHHGEARTWKKTVEYFSEAKILKVTGTPFRSDGLKITGKEVFNYPLSSAMANGYVKSLERFTYLPDEMFFKIKNDDHNYTLEEILKLKDEDWVSRSVALSTESNRSIVNKSVEKLKIKRELTNNNPHKIVAVACSIEHAEQIAELYIEAGMRVTVIHSDMDKSIQEEAFKTIETHNTDVVVNVALLGEGYDHKFLSIAAIFRPFRSDLPYQQFIGRVLRTVSMKDGFQINEEDNIAEVIHHHQLNLDHLWNSYKKELSKSKTIKDMRNTIRNEKILNPKSSLSELDYGNVDESEQINEETEFFLDTDLFKLRERRKAQEEARIKDIMERYSVSLEIARELDKQIRVAQDPDNERLLRPDLYEKDLRQQINKQIVELIIPNIISDYNLTLEGNEITGIGEKFIDKWNCKPYSNLDNNGAVLGKYINTSLKNFINKPRKNWSMSEYERALKQLDSLEKYIRGSLDSYLFK
ncbi:DEAD/DEAH box helicase family protein [Enterococcus hirae]|uniref:DEAD/DEAH box helicase n=1 Tax=Enterococcus hirae TaxID=1354 RepID=UPI0009BDAD0D|nr:DEAD/DEAH box helicase family protein [Enterococcus hirae]EMF0074949.1 DEAD/DEAH box helicase family protein [Enterococcus hirae]MDU1571491.1 DEAD/DEAH box helicase family protein [Enterococcus hirae]OQO44485.1 restriction endonuclease subunit R [Enterococcus hirae]